MHLESKSLTLPTTLWRDEMSISLLHFKNEIPKLKVKWDFHIVYIKYRNNCETTDLTHMWEPMLDL